MPGIGEGGTFFSRKTHYLKKIQEIKNILREILYENGSYHFSCKSLCSDVAPLTKEIFESCAMPIDVFNAAPLVGLSAVKFINVDTQSYLQERESEQLIWMSCFCVGGCGALTLVGGSAS